MNYFKLLRNNNSISFSTYHFNETRQTVPDLTLRCIFSGDEEYHIGRRKLLICPGSFLNLNPGTQYTSSNISHTPVQAFSISFDQRFLDDFNKSTRMEHKRLLDGPDHLKLDDRMSETLYPLSGDLKFTVSHLKTNLENGLSDELLINEYLHHCLLNFSGLYNQQFYQKAELLTFTNRSTRIEILRRLNLAREYLHSNFDRQVNLDELAGYACLSVNHLLRTFKEAYGISPHQYLNLIRLKRAAQLLKSTKTPVTDIVTRIGFECPCSFSRLFKRHFGKAPLQYKKFYSRTFAN